MKFAVPIGASVNANVAYATFERAGVERIAVNAAGCGSSMKEYGQLLADDRDLAGLRHEHIERVHIVKLSVENMDETGDVAA